MSISINAEKAFNKFQHSLLIVFNSMKTQTKTYLFSMAEKQLSEINRKYYPYLEAFPLNSGRKEETHHHYNYIVCFSRTSS